MRKTNQPNTAILIALIVAIVSACSLPVQPEQKEEPSITVTILHFNDIYEITPVSGGKEGGISRVATLKKQLEQSR